MPGYLCFAIPFTSLQSPSPVFTTYGKNGFKWREKLLLPQAFFVSLHRQSKEQPIVPKTGHLLRPERGLNDGRRRSSIKTRKRGRNGAFRVVVIYKNS